MAETLDSSLRLSGQEASSAATAGGEQKATYVIPWSRPDIGSNEIDEVVKVMRSGWASQGAVTREFELMLAKYCGVNYAIVVNSGSSALLCSFMAHGAKPRDHVLIPDYTHIATANVPKLLGCRVSLVDIDRDTFNVDYLALERAVRRRRPKFVVAVDVAGLPNDMHFLSTLAQRYEFTLIEDAAESIGAEYNHQRVGSHGHTATLSFHAAKQLTTIEGGAILTNDPRIANRCRMIRNHGETARFKYFSRLVGMNFRTTDLQSAIGIAQLKKLDDSLSRRDQLARIYGEKLSGLFTFQRIPSYATRHAHMMFLAVARSRRIRDKVDRHLQRQGIETRIPWPPIHKQVQFKNAKTGFPRSSSLYERAISLPLYNTMRDSDAEKVVSEVLAGTALH
jgi:perosamine synthetase